MSAAINVLIPSGHSSWALPVINCLSYYSKFRIFLLSAKKRYAAKFSRHIAYHKFYPGLNDVNDKINIINEEISQNSISIVIPLDEEEIIFFINNSSKFFQAAKIIPLPSITSYKNAIEKSRLNIFLNDSGIQTPNTINFPSNNFLINVEKNLSFPVLIKPSIGQGGEGIFKINTFNEFKRVFKEKQGEFILQEYIDGFDIDCSVLCSNGEILTHTIQKCYISANNPFNQQLGVEFLDNEEVYKIVKKLMSTLDWSGVAHIDLRYDNKSKTYKIIEINARFWGSVEASRVAGINFPYLICQLTLGEEIEKQKFKHIKYLRLKGFLKKLKKNPLMLFNFKLIKNNTGFIEVIKDPMPSIFKLKEKIKVRFN